MSVFGHDPQGRKNVPIFFLITRYFPKALVEVTRVCVAGNAQHNPELPLFDINWSRGKSTDQLNTALRHMIDHAVSGPMDEEPNDVLVAMKAHSRGTYHLAKAAWRILAALELQIEEDQAKMPSTMAEGAFQRPYPFKIDNRPHPSTSYALQNQASPYEPPVDPTHD